jgi:hypothetical protein
MYGRGFVEFLFGGPSKKADKELLFPPPHPLRLGAWGVKIRSVSPARPSTSKASAGVASATTRSLTRHTPRPDALLASGRAYAIEGPCP